MVQKYIYELIQELVLQKRLQTTKINLSERFFPHKPFFAAASWLSLFYAVKPPVSDHP